jgi:DNA primase catalytic core
MTAPSSPDNPIGVDPARLVAAHRQARTYYRQQLATADGPRRYLTHRGLGPLIPTGPASAFRVEGSWHLGYAPPGWTNLVDHLTRLDYTPSELIAAGLAIRARTGGLVDVFRDRVMFPIHDPHGEPIAFTGRAPDRATDVPKYLNTTDTVIYHKGQTLYGLGEQRDRVDAGWAPVIVEGPVDVLAVWLAHPQQAGVGRAAVAACGTSVTEHHAATICALPGAARHGVTIAFDDDPAGRPPNGPGTSCPSTTSTCTPRPCHPAPTRELSSSEPTRRRSSATRSVTAPGPWSRPSLTSASTDSPSATRTC